RARAAERKRTSFSSCSPLSCAVGAARDYRTADGRCLEVWCEIQTKSGGAVVRGASRHYVPRANVLIRRRVWGLLPGRISHQASTEGQVVSRARAPVRTSTASSTSSADD